MENQREDGLKRRDIFLGMICVMFFLDTVGPVASMGPASIGWSLIITAIFFFPSGLIMAEMGSRFPAEGGMYRWVKLAYGKRWGARISWYYWVNNAIWISSTSIFTVSILGQVFLGAVSFPAQIAMAVAMIWLIILFGLRPLKATTFLTNMAAVFKITIALSMALAAAFFLLRGNAPANDFSLARFIPRLDEGFIFFPALIYNYLGFEVMSTVGNKMKNPVRDVPVATLGNAVLISVLYIVAVLAILVIVPSENTTIVTAIMDCFFFLGELGFAGDWIVYGLGLIFLSILFSQAVTWIVAAGRMAAAAGKDGELPAVFAKMHKKNETPIGALLITGIIGTVLTLFYGYLVHSAEDLYWMLFSFTNIIFLLPYGDQFSGVPAPAQAGGARLWPIGCRARRRWVPPFPYWARGF